MAPGLVTPLTVPAVALVGAAAGLLATLVMDIPMRALLPEGMTPPLVAAGALTGTATGDAPRRVAMAAHYGAGTGGGLTFTTLVALAALAVPGPAVAGVPVAALAAAAVVEFAVLFAFFAYVVLPRYGTVTPERVPAVRRDWAVSAAVYTVSVAVLLPVLLWVVG